MITKKRENQIIISGKESMERWAATTNRKTSRVISNVFKVGSRTPYFFQNPLIDNGELFTAYPAYDFNAAIENSLSHSFVKMKRNPTQLAYTLYSYTSETNITKHRVSGIKNAANIILMGCKKDNRTYFVSLVPFIR